MTSKTKQYLSKTVTELKPSGIRKFFDLAASMEDVISLGVGEPDFVTAWSIREACIASLEQGYTSYTANSGLLALRYEIANYLETRFSIQYNPTSEIVVTVGASQALDLALRATVDTGDEVIVIEPSFVSYAPLVALAGGKPVVVSTSKEDDFKLTASTLKEAITSRTKAIMLCSPNNPTGTVLTKADLQALAEVINEHDLVVISDEIYAELTYEDEYCSFAGLDGMFDRTILVSGFSKAFAMTGWRLGYVAATEELAKAMLKIHQYTMMCAPINAQYAAIEALQSGLEGVANMKKSYRRRRNYFVTSLNEIGLTCHIPGGAFYAFPSVEITGLTSQQFAEQLLIEEKVAVVPGDVFGQCGEGHVRCSYASSLEQLQEAVKRMERFVKNYQ
ncbi:aminotransferase [Bacillus sp. HMF5848]|uniref:aminotransferase n=1 Tax=Bacillus sp. HMF5848 TaxID=2495421 RepID=UPI000F770257|nr:aminotransferase [Bacillus sp. HMF5848]RSK28394.1 aminotransferase [Bacillus sp. HMF5848]